MLLKPIILNSEEPSTPLVWESDLDGASEPMLCETVRDDMVDAVDALLGVAASALGSCS